MRWWHWILFGKDEREEIRENDKLIEIQKNRPPKMVDHGYQLISMSEGYSPVPYICPAGVCTIGKGTTLDANFNPVTMEHPQIDIAEANKLFYRDVKLFSRSVRNSINVPLTDNQFSALVSLSYNIGQGRFRASTLRRKLNRGDYEGAENEFWKWRRADGVILSGLVKRRELERKLFMA